MTLQPSCDTDWDSFQQTNIQVLALVDLKLKNSDLAYRVARAALKAGSNERAGRLGTLRRYYSDLKVLIEVTYGDEYLYILALESRQAVSRIGVREQLLDVHAQGQAGGQHRSPGGARLPRSGLCQYRTDPGGFVPTGRPR